MAPVPDHAKPPKRRDHLWVLVIIAVCALIEVWASWIAIGSMSGFPKIGGARGLSTDWTLAVTTEAYWGYALYSWLAAAPGPRSRKFAMWSAIAVFVLSLTGQGAAHLVEPGTKPPAALVVFVTALPVLVLALIAVLVHLRQVDREEAEAEQEAAVRAEREAAVLRAEADERTALRAEIAGMREAHAAALDAAGENLDAERAARETAEQEAARLAAAVSERDDAVAAMEAAQAAAEAAEAARSEAARQAAESAEKIESLNRRLARLGGAKGRSTGTGESRKNRDTTVPSDFDAQAAALSILAEEPGISGAKLAERVGMSERWGQAFKKQLATRATGGEETG